MGKDFASWMHQQCPPHDAPNLNCTSFAPDSEWPKALPECANSTRLVSNETKPRYTRYQMPHAKTSPTNEPSGWFYGLPRYRQALTPAPDCSPKKLNTSNPEGYSKDATRDAMPPSRTEKKFLVFDHSENQTRLICSPGTVYPNQCLNSGNLKAFDDNGDGIDEWKTKAVHLNEANPMSVQENRGSEEESEMHEDTEELNALLYSDEDDESESYCEEEASTGHSPSKTTNNYPRVEAKANAEEVASSGNAHLKRKRLPVEEGSSSSLMDTASSGNRNECEDDAESSCGESSNHRGEMVSSVPGNKRQKREKIRETVSILQSIIPGGKDMDAMYVLDEAIHYLRSLKLKAKSLGESLD
ncbi:hypothetical protein ACHQM5_024124 [Ranunculus cassubicifolius]